MDTSVERSGVRRLNREEARRKERWIKVNEELFSAFQVDQPARNEVGMDAFCHYCNTERCMAAVGQLLRALGANVDAKSTENLTPLMILADYQDDDHLLRAVGELLKHGATVNETDHRGMSAVHHFSQRCFRLEVNKILGSFLEAGADLEMQDQYGNTPLLTSCLANNVCACDALIKLGAQVNIADHHGKTPLQAALEKNNQQVGGMLVEAGAEICHLSLQQVQVLFTVSVESGYEQAACRLLQAGADMDACVGGNTAFLIASMHGLTVTACHLLGLGATLDICNEQGGHSSSFGLHARSRGHSHRAGQGRCLHPCREQRGQQCSTVLLPVTGICT